MVKGNTSKTNFSILIPFALSGSTLGGEGEGGREGGRERERERGNKSTGDSDIDIIYYNFYIQYKERCYIVFP